MNCRFCLMVLLTGVMVVSGCASTPPSHNGVDRRTALPNQALPPLQKADVLVSQGKWVEARKVLDDFIATKPTDWKARIETDTDLTVMYWDQFQFEHCYPIEIVRTKKSLHATVGNSYAKAYYYLAYIAVELNQFPVAMEALDRGLALEPDSATLLAERGTLYQSAESPREAVKNFRAATELKSCVTDDVMGKAYRGLGVSLIDLGDLDQAEQALNTSLKYSPDNPNALHELQYLVRMRAGKQKAQPLELNHPK